MERQVRSLIAVFVVSTACLAAHSFVDRGVFLPQVSTTDIPLATPTTVTVSAIIGADPNLVLSSIQCVQYDAKKGKKPIRPLCQLYDDGVNGDDRPGDTRFSGQVTFNEAQTGTIVVRITAAYAVKKKAKAYLSPPIYLSVFRPLTTPEFDVSNSVLTEAENLFATLIQTMTRAQAAQQVLASLLADPDVRSASLAGDWLVFMMNSGVIQSLTVGDLSDTDGRVSSPSLPPLAPDILDGCEECAPPTDNGASRPPATDKTPGNSKLLIWGPGYSNNQTTIVDHAQSRADGAAWISFEPDPSVIVKDAAAGLGSVKTFGSYGTIVMHTHGGWLPNDDTPKTNDKWVCLLSGTANTTLNQLAYAIDIVLHRVVTNSAGLLFTPKFISRWVGSMPDSFVYLGACESLRDETMWSAFSAKGARVGYGWSRTVYRDFNSATFALLFDALVPTSSNTQPKTVMEAYAAIADKNDSHDDPAVFCMRVNSPEWTAMKLVDPDIINGGFETGDFTGWTTGGDYCYATVVGHPHSGACSGALGRWDQSYHGRDPYAEPEGTEYLYQDVKVPANVVRIAFWYDIETYDTAVWDWVDMTIRDTNGGVLQTVLSGAGKPGTDYGPYWRLGWTYQEVDVTAYRGQRIRIFFSQCLDGWGDQQRCYFDDVKFIREQP